MRFVSWNVNGIRAAIRKGIDDYFESLDADVVMLQEVRALPEQLPKGWNWPEGYQVHMHCAEKKGYSGVATLSREAIKTVETGMNGSVDTGDSEGRILVTEHQGFTCINTYLPSGSNKQERQDFKEAWMDEWRVFLAPYLKMKTPVIVCGDLNIAHTEDDIWNAKGNAKSSGFLPQEREWFTQLLNDGWSDAFRNHVGEGEKIYSWWSNRGQAWLNNTGWRLDYHVVSANLAGAAHSCEIYKDERFSDHSPLTIDYRI